MANPSSRLLEFLPLTGNQGRHYAMGKNNCRQEEFLIDARQS